ncbi:hypothetical protein V8G54_018832 [Vigna mungo]|uniref:Uncharacterized protein n=1 Tax=Vigna mungo TaxID=3915 RepID=A0AAQ3N9V6_VIGMU
MKSYKRTLPRHRPPIMASPYDSGSPGHAATTPSSRHQSTVATPPQHRRQTKTTLPQNPQIGTNDQPAQPAKHVIKPSTQPTNRRQWTNRAIETRAHNVNSRHEHNEEGKGRGVGDDDKREGNWGNSE